MKIIIDVASDRSLPIPPPALDMLGVCFWTGLTHRLYILHIACAEDCNADVLLTTDDRMLRLAARSSAILKVRVENPARWSEEVAE